MPALTVAQIAELCGGLAEGDTRLEVSSVGSLESASESQLSFVANRKAAGASAGSNAACLLVPPDFDNVTKRTVIRVSDPRRSFALAARTLHARPAPKPGIHPSAVIALSADVPTDCTIGPNVVIGERTSIGRGTRLMAGCVLGDDVAIGEFCILQPNVTIYAGVRLQNRVILHSGCVIGADGFGFAFTGDHYEKFPQIGSVEIEDDVELGANTCVDRAALGTTRIGRGTKVDNMVHVGHNCTIGRHVVIAAQSGFSGGVSIGDYAVIGGQVGVGDKATIQSKAIVGSGAGILSSKIVRAGEPVWGTPARPLREHLRQLATLARLANIRRTHGVATEPRPRGSGNEHLESPD
jgi:UDP-3-O-[3-hydroxymyristoyl] glucosamine N-acyltransferase